MPIGVSSDNRETVQYTHTHTLPLRHTQTQDWLENSDVRDDRKREGGRQHS